MKRNTKNTYEDLKAIVLNALCNSGITGDFKQNKVNIFKMRYIDGMWDSEIAKLLNLSQSTISQQALEMRHLLESSVFVPEWKYKKRISINENEIEVLKLEISKLKNKMGNYRKTISLIRNYLISINTNTNEG